eukprot:1898645-Pleurochrysis_carterae.AAC.2
MEAALDDEWRAGAAAGTDTPDIPGTGKCAPIGGAMADICDDEDDVSGGGDGDDGNLALSLGLPAPL